MHAICDTERKIPTAFLRRNFYILLAIWQGICYKQCAYVCFGGADLLKGELLFFVELIGIVAFSVSGAVSAFRKHMDLFGVIILGACTALGGGALRDIMLGMTPPAMFKNPVYAVVAALASLAVFIPQVRRLIGGNRAYEIVMLVMDSLGLGVFTVVGIQTALEKNGDYAPFLLCLRRCAHGSRRRSSARCSGR